MTIAVDWDIKNQTQPKNKVLFLIPNMYKPPINAHVDLSSRTRGLNFGLSLCLHPYFVYASSKDFVESAHMF